MNVKTVGRWGWLAAGVAGCLAVSACRTCCEGEGQAPYDEGFGGPFRNAAQQMMMRKLKSIIVPEVEFGPPTTLIDFVDFFAKASRDYDDPKIPLERRGLSITAKLPPCVVKVGGSADDPFDASLTNPVLPPMRVRSISLYDLLQLVCDVTGMKPTFPESGTVMIVPSEACWYTQTYDLGLICHRATDPEQPILAKLVDAIGQDTDTELKAFFADYGVQWPDGSSITHLKVANKLRVVNTSENLTRLGDALHSLIGNGFFPIRVEVQVVAFRTADITKLQLAGDMTKDALMDLQKAGKSKPVATASILTHSGQEGVTRTVQEMIYPSELCWNGGSGETATFVPSNFTRDEIGVVLKALPENNDFDTSYIHVDLELKWVALKGWESYPVGMVTEKNHKAVMSFRQPVFATESFETRVIVRNGDTILLESGSAVDSEWVHATFLTVRQEQLGGDCKIQVIPIGF